MRIAFKTLGCKVNTYETESIWELFQTKGYKRVDAKDFADVYVINTCTVTNSGDAKSRKTIRQIIKRNPESVVAVMGCYSQMEPEQVFSIEGVDIVIGTKHREQLVELVEEHLRKRNRILEVSDVSRYREFDETHVTSFTENTRAFVKIQDGCNNFCTYCIIPFARGPVRSRDKNAILDEVKHLVQNNYKEIVLTGIHTGGYGSDLKDYSFTQLLVDLSQIEGLERIRISSIEMNELNDEIVELYQQNKKFAPHFHIPLQSGSERILKAMNRKYTKNQFRSKLKKIRQMLPNVAITTDVIVGFPGETEEEFEEMVSFIEELKFSELHVFPYSRRSGTKAAMMKDQVNGVIKSMRVNRLLALNEKLANDYIKNQGHLYVIFETSDQQYTYGHTDNYIYVRTERNASLHNQLVTCKIVSGTYRSLDVKKIS
jgi:threonylcarbamoyladenosine tRNA methylthiotransferase MtaB